MDHKRLVVIHSEVLGEGSRELGAKLMGSFLRRLATADRKPEVMLFYNSGVNLLAEGSHVLDALKILSDAGVDLVACGTCAGYYGVSEKMAVGRVSDPYGERLFFSALPPWHPPFQCVA